MASTGTVAALIADRSAAACGIANDMEPIARPKQILVVPELRKTH